jgi:hypothetical protein
VTFADRAIIGVVEADHMQKKISLLLVVLSTASLFAFSGSFEMSRSKTEPTPTPASQPIVSTASAFGVSPRVDQLAPVPIQKSSEPREINPQNTIPVKVVKSRVSSKKATAKPASRKRQPR